MKKIHFICFAFVFIFLTNSCRKDVGKVIVPELPLPNLIDSVQLPFACEDTAANWVTFEQSPLFVPSMKSGSLGVHRGLYDPLNSDVIYYMITDSVPKSTRRTHCLYRYNRRTRTKTKLDCDLLGNIDINKNGWLVYDKVNGNIYKIKTNGDSITMLTKNGKSQNPRWSDDGNFVYVYDTENINVCTYRIDKNGAVFDTLKFALPYSYSIAQKKELLYYYKLDNNERKIIERNLSTKLERTVLSNANCLGQAVNDFYLINNGSSLAWEAENGLFITDLNSLATIQIINSQRNSLNMVSTYWISPINGRILGRQMNVKYVSYYYSEIDCYLLEYEPDGKCRRRLTLPD